MLSRQCCQRDAWAGMSMNAASSEVLATPRSGEFDTKVLEERRQSEDTMPETARRLRSLLGPKGVSRKRGARRGMTLRC